MEGYTTLQQTEIIFIDMGQSGTTCLGKHWQYGEKKSYEGTVHAISSKSCFRAYLKCFSSLPTTGALMMQVNVTSFHPYTPFYLLPCLPSHVQSSRLTS